MPPHLDLIPLAGFTGLMAIAAFEDLRRLVIPNPVVLGLGALWPFHLATAPTPTLAGILSAAGCAAAVFVAGALLFSRGLIGGGDVKLLAASTLWAGPELTPPLLVVTAVLGGALSVALLLPVALRVLFSTSVGLAEVVKPVPVPYGVAIASATLIVTLPPNLN
jgi:prepilin peptidase CpaA